MMRTKMIGFCGILGAFLNCTAVGQMVHEDHRYVVGPDAPGWDHYGASVAMDNGVMAVGAWNAFQAPDHIPEQGFVYLYDANTSVLLRTLMADEPVPFGQFGLSMDMDGGLIVVGAPDSWGNSSFDIDSGSAYVFDANTGEQLLTLRPDGPLAVGWFGHAVAIDNGVVAVWGVTNEADGTRYGSVYLFDAATGNQVDMFQPAGQEGLNFWFGHSMDLDSGRLAVNEQAIQGGNEVGTVKLFDINTGNLFREFVPQDAADQHESFGLSISMDQWTIAVSSWLDDGLDRRGVVYAYDINGGTQYTRYAPCCVLYQMSDDIELNDGIIGIGMFTNYHGGVVHLVDAYGGNVLNVLKPSGGDFGLSEIDIAMKDGVIGVGTDDEDETVGSGHMYFFGAICSPDLNGDDELDFFDISTFINAFIQGEFEADFDNNMSFDFFDVFGFIKAFQEGCQ